MSHKDYLLDPADRALDVLALAPVTVQRRYQYGDTWEGYDQLVLRGLAEKHVEGAIESKWNTVTYRLTEDGWRTVYARNARKISVAAAIKRRGLDEKRAVRNLISGLRNRARAVAAGCRVFPSIRDVSHRFLVEGQIQAPTINEDEEVSHPEVTRWYVEQYVKANNLKGA